MLFIFYIKKSKKTTFFCNYLFFIIHNGKIFKYDIYKGVFNMKKIFNEKLFTAIIIASIFAFPIFQTIGIFFKIDFFLQEEFLSLLGVLCTFFTIIYLVFFYKKNTEKKIVLSDIFILTSIIFCIISIIFSKCIKISLTGFKNYSETPLQVLGYFGLFFVCSNITETKNKKSILYSLLFLGIIEAIVAFLQNFSLWPVTSYCDPEWHIKDHLAFGFTQHCNFFAPIAIIFTALYATKFIYSKTTKEKYFCLLFSIVCCLSILFTYTRIGWVGIISILLGIMFLEVSLYTCKKDKATLKKHIKRYLVILFSFTICVIVVGSISGQLQRDIEESKKELYFDNFNSFGTNRGKIWMAGLGALKKFPFTGVGFDIYSFSFSINPQYGFSTQNKGHNEYIHTLVTQGIFSGINYLAFVFYCCHFSYKKIIKGSDEYSKSDTTKFFWIAVFAYFVQALFNSSVTNVAVYKWILMGLLLTRQEQKNLIPVFKKIIKICNTPVVFSKDKK